MAVMIPVTIQTMRARPTEPAFSSTPFGETKIPEPMMFPAQGTKTVRSGQLAFAFHSSLVWFLSVFEVVGVSSNDSH